MEVDQFDPTIMLSITTNYLLGFFHFINGYNAGILKNTISLRLHYGVVLCSAKLAWTSKRCDCKHSPEAWCHWNID